MPEAKTFPYLLRIIIKKAVSCSSTLLFPLSFYCSSACMLLLVASDESRLPDAFSAELIGQGSAPDVDGVGGGV